MEVFSVVALAALLKKFVDLFKQFKLGPEGRNAVLTQLFVFALGVAFIWLAAATKFMATVDIGGYPLGDFDWAAKVLAGLALGALASTYLDTQKALDNTQTTALPALFGKTAPVVEPIVVTPVPAKKTTRTKPKKIEPLS